MKNPFFILLLCVAAVGSLGAAEAPAWRKASCVAVDPAKQSLYVGMESGDLLFLSSPKAAPAPLAKLPSPLYGIARSSDGRLAVTCGEAEGKLLLLDPIGKPLKEIAVGHTPKSPVFSPDGRIVWCCNQFSNSISVVDAETGKVIAQWAAAREPLSAAVTPDGSRLVVMHQMGEGAANEKNPVLRVLIYDTKTGQPTSLELPSGSSNGKGVAVSPDGAYAYVTHILGRNLMPTTQIERGWIATNAVTVIDLKKAAIENTVLLDEPQRGSANLWGIAVSPDGAQIGVASAGCHELIVLDRKALHDRLGAVTSGTRVTEVSSKKENVPNDLSFTVGVKRRNPIEGKGPRAVAVVGNEFVTVDYFTDTLSFVVRQQAAPVPSRTLALGAALPPDPVREGALAFHDAKFCYQNWLSCSSCHPGEARADGLNWDLLNDGIGTPKQTKSMLLSLQTPPAMSLGVRESGSVAIRAGMQHIQFVQPDEAVAHKIEAYFLSLKPVALRSKAQTDQALLQRGKAVFTEQRCDKCHPAPLYTSLEAYDVDTGIGVEAKKQFDTPTLVEIWRTAPYLHDGRAATLTDVLKLKHGLDAPLKEEDIKALVYFMESL